MPKRRRGNQVDRRTSLGRSSIHPNKLPRSKQEDAIPNDKENNDGWPYTFPTKSQPANGSFLSSVESKTLNSSGSKALEFVPSSTDNNLVCQEEGMEKNKIEQSLKENQPIGIIFSEKSNRTAATLLDYSCNAVEKLSSSSKDGQSSISEDHLTEEDMEAILDGSAACLRGLLDEEELQSNLKGPNQEKEENLASLDSSLMQQSPTPSFEVAKELKTDAENIFNQLATSFVHSDNQKFPVKTGHSLTTSEFHRDDVTKEESYPEEALIKPLRSHNHEEFDLMANIPSPILTNSSALGDSTIDSSRSQIILTEESNEDIFNNLICCLPDDRKVWYERIIELLKIENQDQFLIRLIDVNQFRFLNRLKEDALSLDPEATYGALKIIGLILQHKILLESIETTHVEGLFDCLLSIMQTTSDKPLCHLAIWCISVQQLDISFVKKRLSRLMLVLTETLSPQGPQSATVHFEALNAIEHLLDQDPEGMKNLVQHWGVDSFRLLIMGSSKVRQKAESLLYTKTFLLLLHEAEHNDSFGEQITHAMNHDFIANLNCIVNSPNMELFVIHAWAYMVLLLNYRLAFSPSPPVFQQLLHIAEHYFRHERAQIRSAMIQKWNAMAYVLSRSVLAPKKTRRCLKLLLTPLCAAMRRDRALRVKKACIRSWSYILLLFSQPGWRKRLSRDEIASHLMIPMISVMLSNIEETIWMQGYTLLRNMLENSSETNSVIDLNSSMCPLPHIKTVIFTEDLLPFCESNESFEECVYNSLEALLLPSLEALFERWFHEDHESLQTIYSLRFEKIWSLLVDHATNSICAGAASSHLLNSLVYFVETALTRKEFIQEPQKTRINRSPILLLEHLLKKILTTIKTQPSWGILEYQRPTSSSFSVAVGETLNNALFRIWLQSPFDGASHCSNLHILELAESITQQESEDRLYLWSYSLKWMEAQPFLTWNRLVFWEALTKRVLSLILETNQKGRGLVTSETGSQLREALFQSIKWYLLTYGMVDFPIEEELERNFESSSLHSSCFEVYKEVTNILEQFRPDDLDLGLKILFSSIDEKLKTIAPFSSISTFIRFSLGIQKLFSILAAKTMKSYVETSNKEFTPVISICARLLSNLYSFLFNKDLEWLEHQEDILHFIFEFIESFPIAHKKVDEGSLLSEPHISLIESLVIWLRDDAKVLISEKPLALVFTNFWTKFFTNQIKPVLSTEPPKSKLIWKLLEAALESPLVQISTIALEFCEYFIAKFQSASDNETLKIIDQKRKELQLKNLRLENDDYHFNLDDNNHQRLNSGSSTLLSQNRACLEECSTFENERPQKYIPSSPNRSNNTIDENLTSSSFHTPEQGKMFSTRHERKDEPVSPSFKSSHLKNSKQNQLNAERLSSIDTRNNLQQRSPNSNPSCLSPRFSSPQGILKRQNSVISELDASRYTGLRVSFYLPQEDKEERFEGPKQPTETLHHKEISDRSMENLKASESYDIMAQISDGTPLSSGSTDENKTIEPIEKETSPSSNEQLTTSVIEARLTALQECLIPDSASPNSRKFSRIHATEWLQIQRKLTKFLLVVNDHIEAQMAS